MAAGQQKTIIEIPDTFDSKTRKSIAEDIIEFIKDRSIEGVGFNPKTKRNFTYPAYTKQYAEFKGQDNVDLIFSGNMFDGMQMLSSNKGKITIGFKAGSTENAKAEGNQLGTYGQPKPIPGKARPFLGIQKKDLEDILSQYKVKDEIREEEQRAKVEAKGTDLEVIGALARFLGR